MVRSFGTNNLPDCSNMCHESSGTALMESIGVVGKGSVTVEDTERADPSSSPGRTGHQPPRMLGAGKAKAAGGADHRRQSPSGGRPDPLRRPADGGWCDRAGVAIADEFVQIRLGGDMALFRGSPGCCWRPRTGAPAASSTAISRRAPPGFRVYAAAARAVDLGTVQEATGVSESNFAGSPR